MFLGTLGNILTVRSVTKLWLKDMVLIFKDGIWIKITNAIFVETKSPSLAL
jgi:hypothetical protein